MPTTADDRKEKKVVCGGSSPLTTLPLSSFFPQPLSLHHFQGYYHRYLLFFAPSMRALVHQTGADRELGAWVQELARPGARRSQADACLVCIW
ncbi:hypothetical protein RIF29_21468 [Crotalaria pallida]|uniref:Uncharacterized protein n=1 Tax=Crotalaria pallida TaxID=3830 RepID=A0AAN9F5C8_CROPI